MATNQRQSRGLLDFTAAEDLVSGQVYLLGDTVGVVQNTAATGAAAVLDATPGHVYEVPCLGTDVVGVGDSLFWDDTNARMTLTATGNFYAGKAANESPNGVTVVEVMLVNGNAVVG